jgi:hypothetical protein
VLGMFPLREQLHALNGKCIVWIHPRPIFTLNYDERIGNACCLIDPYNKVWAKTERRIKRLWRLWWLSAIV